MEVPITEMSDATYAAWDWPGGLIGNGRPWTTMLSRTEIEQPLLNHIASHPMTCKHIASLSFHMRKHYNNLPLKWKAWHWWTQKQFSNVRLFPLFVFCQLQLLIDNVFFLFINEERYIINHQFLWLKALVDNFLSLLYWLFWWCTDRPWQRTLCWCSLMVVIKYFLAMCEEIFLTNHQYHH